MKMSSKYEKELKKFFELSKKFCIVKTGYSLIF